MGENDGKRHQLWGFGSGVSEHETLTSTTVLKRALVKTLSDIRRLLLNGNEDVAGPVVKTLGRVVVSNVLDGFSDDLLVVKLGLCECFAENRDHSGLGSSLARDLEIWVLLQTGIKLHGIYQKDWRGDGTGDTHNSVKDLITDLVRVTLADRLGGKEEVVKGKGWARRRGSWANESELVLSTVSVPFIVIALTLCASVVVACSGKQPYPNQHLPTTCLGVVFLICHGRFSEVEMEQEHQMANSGGERKWGPAIHRTEGF